MPPEAGGISDEAPLRFSPGGSAVLLDMEPVPGGLPTTPHADNRLQITSG